MKKQLEAMKNKQKEDVVDQLMSDFRNAKLAEIREGLTFRVEGLGSRSSHALPCLSSVR